MRHVLDAIAEKRHDFDGLPLLRRLEGPATIDEALALAASIAFFTHASKDLLRINAELIDDPLLRRFARRHYLEEYAHDRWLRRDLATLGIEVDLPTIFNRDHRADREVGYRLIAEALTARHDAARIALLWVMEMTGQSFFARTPRYFRRAAVPGQLIFYGQTHLDAEHGHELFQDPQRCYVESLRLAAEQRQDAIAVALRCYDAITDLMNACEQLVAAHSPCDELTPV
jgi:hypothetical protein